MISPEFGLLTSILATTMPPPLKKTPALCLDWDWPALPLVFVRVRTPDWEDFGVESLKLDEKEHPVPCLRSICHIQDRQVQARQPVITKRCPFLSMALRPRPIESV
jgi:hypothetical protein